MRLFLFLGISNLFYKIGFMSSNSTNVNFLFKFSKTTDYFNETSLSFQYIYIYIYIYISVPLCRPNMSHILKSSALSKFYRSKSLKNLSNLIAQFHPILAMAYPTWIVYLMDSLQSYLWTRTHLVTKIRFFLFWNVERWTSIK